MEPKRCPQVGDSVTFLDPLTGKPLGGTAVVQKVECPTQRVNYFILTYEGRLLGRFGPREIELV